jgi:tRNA threonylcarbamoyladenosine biosynthesis protein TsaE
VTVVSGGLAQFDIEVPDECSMLDFGRRLAVAITELATPLVITLSGDLGAGKTTLCRGLLTELGHVGAVKSPTYTLVESYQLLLGWVYHFDLYRLNDAEELEYIGFSDYLADSVLCLIEWPDKGEGFIPKADVGIKIKPSSTGRHVSVTADFAQSERLMGDIGGG